MGTERELKCGWKTNRRSLSEIMVGVSLEERYADRGHSPKMIEDLTGLGIDTVNALSSCMDISLLFTTIMMRSRRISVETNILGT